MVLKKRIKKMVSSAYKSFVIKVEKLGINWDMKHNSICFFKKTWRTIDHFIFLLSRMSSKYSKSTYSELYVYCLKMLLKICLHIIVQLMLLNLTQLMFMSFTDIFCYFSSKIINKKE